ncbi:DUF927 domain-containing protein [Listeria booriae]|uniref:DUF927 domain-containing protein n=1 Tax=Listeria booriae TaxID=1552123 RepID=A0A7X0TMK1_9LIST|nr:DUF927 domain-containing protein [Listeria booriae]MBC1331853.1 DUF927 domain-containing protein [Listeria booriae]MBC2371274.1 DUF927 domain-containing protein [Listeria booriae]MBC2387630.1 DUF927 domain-containing protein [Listeria booriae]
MTEIIWKSSDDRFVLTEEELLVWDAKNEKYRYLSDYMQLSGRYKDVETKEEYCILTYATGYQSSREQIELRGEQLQSNKIQELNKYGVAITQANKENVLAALLAMRKELPITKFYDYYGFRWNGNKSNIGFFGEKALGFPDSENWMLASESRYNLHPSGSSETWWNMYKEHIQGSRWLEFAVVMGLSSAIVGYLKLKEFDITNLFIHLVADSSKGKTTAAMLAMSVAGNPTTKKRGLVKTWQTTANALLLQLENNHGIPIAFDELSMAPKGNLSDLLYAIADGTQKARANKNAVLKSIKNWYLTVISTGEVSVFSRLSENTGLKVRIMELDVAFTDNAAQAEAIKDVVAKHYGHVMPTFIQGLYEKGLEHIDAVYEEEQKLCVDVQPDSPLKHRLANRLAVLTTTARLMNEQWDLGLDLEGLREQLVANETSSVDARSVEERALDDIIREAIQNQAYYHAPRTTDMIKSQFHGYVELRGNKLVLSVLKQVCDKALTVQGKYQDIGIIAKGWKKAGYLKTERDKTSKRKSVTLDEKSVREPFYELHVSQEYAQYFNVLGLSPEIASSGFMKYERQNNVIFPEIDLDEEMEGF